MDSRSGMRGGQGISSRDYYKEKTPKGFKTASMQQFSPEMMELFQQLFSHVGPESFTGRLAKGDQSMFEEMEAPAMQQFSGMLGNLGSRFSGMGMGGRKSSGFQNASSQSASDFAQQLQSNRMGLQRQAVGDLQNFAAMLLGQKPMERSLVEKPQSFGEQLALTGVQAAGNVAGSYLRGGG